MPSLLERITQPTRAAKAVDNSVERTEPNAEPKPKNTNVGRRDPANEPPGTADYEKPDAQVETAETAETAETVETVETVAPSTPEVPSFLQEREDSTSRFSTDMPGVDRTKSTELRQRFARDYDFDASTPEGRRRKEALRRMADRGLTDDYKSKFLQYLEEREELPEEQEKFYGREKVPEARRFRGLTGKQSEMEMMRQSTGGFMREPQAPKGVGNSDPAAVQEKIDTRIGELAERLTDPSMDFGNPDGVVMNTFVGPESRSQVRAVTAQEVIDEVAQEDRGEGELMLPFGTDRVAAMRQIMDPSERRRFPEKAKLLDQVKDDYREYERVRDQIEALKSLRKEFAAE